MPTLTEKQCDDIIRYLQTEAFKDNVLKGPFIDDVVDLLNDNGYSIPSSSRGKTLLGTAGNTQRYAILKSDKVSLQQADADSVALGFSDLVERDDYTRHVQVKGKATTGTQKTSKVTPAGVTPPSRALNATFFDHNGMMAKNIISIAAIGVPEVGWISSAKKVAAGTNYTTEFPISVGASYIQGDRGINQALQGTATSTPANVQPPIPPTATTKPKLVVTEEETVEEETVAVPEVSETPVVSGIVYPDTLTGKQSKGLIDAKMEKRRLSISKWEERDKLQSGMYPYPLKDQPIYFILTPSSADVELQITNEYINPEDDDSGWGDEDDGTSSAPAFTTPLGILIVALNKKIAFTTDIDSGECVNLTTKQVKDYTLKWGQPGSSHKIELFEAKNASGEVIFKVIEGQIVELDSPAVLFGDSATEFLTTNINANIEQKTMQIMFGQDSEGTEMKGSTSYGDVNTEAGLEGMIDWIDNHRGVHIFFYSTECEPVATVDVYEYDMEDVDGSKLAGDEVLSRIAGTVSDVIDASTTYLKVWLNLDYAGAKTTDLFSGRVTDSNSRLTALIFPGDQIDVDIQGINSKLGLEDQLDKVTALKVVTTSNPIPSKDSDGNDLGYATVSDATITFEHDGKTEVIQIPDVNGELMGFDRNGDEIRGQIESIEVHTGNAAAQYETQKMIRRSNRMSPSYNIPNPSATDQNATASVAFRIGRKYYVVGRRGGQPILIEIDLNYQQEA